MEAQSHAGGERSAWERVAPLLSAIAAKAEDGTPCVAYIGKGGASHYIKMVHNGIEYADMQFIAEIYALLRRGCGLAPVEIGDLFAEWNRGESRSYLMEITVDILHRADPETALPW